MSDHGDVWSKTRLDRLGRKVGGHLLKQTPRGKRGYLCVNIEGRLRQVHHLVLETFVSPRPRGALGCHANDVADDNRASNLTWGTFMQNAADRKRNGGYVKAVSCVNEHRYTPENTWLTKEGYQQCRTCHRDRERERKRMSADSGRPR